jgi:hypothetical protein
VNGRIHLVLLCVARRLAPYLGFSGAECNRQTPASAARPRIAGDPATRSCNLGPQIGQSPPVRKKGQPCN